MDARPLTIVTYDWVPEFPRGFVRDIRVRWAAEEAGLPYRVETVPLRQKSEAHRAIQPFEQVPILKDGALTLFESGAILWHLGEKSQALLPREPGDRAAAIQWLVAGLNSVEPMTMAWLIAKVFDRNPEQAEVAAKRMDQRLASLSPVLEFAGVSRRGPADGRRHPDGGRAAHRRGAGRAGRLSGAVGLCRAADRPSGLPQGACRPDGALGVGRRSRGGGGLNRAACGPGSCRPGSCVRAAEPVWSRSCGIRPGRSSGTR